MQIYVSEHLPSMGLGDLLSYSPFSRVPKTVVLLEYVTDYYYTGGCIVTGHLFQHMYRRLDSRIISIFARIDYANPNDDLFMRHLIVI
jgi:hypothetical protein